METKTKVRVAIMLVLLIPAIYFSISYTVEWVLETKVATVTILELDNSLLSDMVVCTSQYIDTAKLRNDSQLGFALAYSLGLYVNARPSTFNAPGSKGENNDELYAKFRDAYQKLGMTNLELLQAASGFKVPASNDSTILLPIAVTPNFIDPQVGCATVSGRLDYENGLSGLTNLPVSMRSRRVYTFELPGESKFFGSSDSPLYLSFMKTKNLSLTSLMSDFLRLDVGSLTKAGSVTTITLTLEPTAFTRYSTRSEPCESKGNEARLPKDLAMKICEMECEDLAIAEIYNCSILKAVVPEFSDKPVCNQFDGGPRIEYFTTHRNGSAHSGILGAITAKEECTWDRRCKSRWFCEEFAFKYYNTFMSSFSANYTKEKTVDVFVYTKRSYTLIKEDLSVSTDGWIGTVGGILGLWVGWSFVTCIDWGEALVNRFFQKKKRKERH